MRFLYRFLSFSLLALIFSWKVFAVGPGQDELFQRLGIDEAFLNSPVCSVRRDGGAFVYDFSVLPNDPNIASGHVTLLGEISKTEGKYADHGNLVAGITSKFLPKGRTFLRQVKNYPTTFLDSLGEDMREVSHLSRHPIFAVNYSIYSLADFDEAYLTSLCNQISQVLSQNRIFVIAAGNEGLARNPRCIFSRIFSRLSPEQRRFVIFVGATRQKNGREVLDSSYSNIAERFKDQFLLAPSRFPQYSLVNQSQEASFGTSYSAPVITALITRAFLANPLLTREDVIHLLFETADKRNLIGMGDANFDRQLYGHGMIDARLFLQAAHSLNHTRQNNLGVTDFPLRLGQRPNIFRNFRENLRDKLDLMNMLADYEDLFKSDFQRVAREGLTNLESQPPSFFTLDDFFSCSEIFRARNASDEAFTSFALSKFSPTSMSQTGSSLLTRAIRDNRKDLTAHLLKRNFDIHLRGNNLEGQPGSLPIHAATFVGNAGDVHELIRRGSNIRESVGCCGTTLLFTVTGAKHNSPNVSERLKILDLLYHEGADFKQKYGEKSLTEMAEEALGKDSPITQKVKYYAENPHRIRRKPLKKNRTLAGVREPSVRSAPIRPSQATQLRAKIPSQPLRQIQGRRVPTRTVPAVAKRPSACPQKPILRGLTQRAPRSTLPARIIVSRKVAANPLPSRKISVRPLAPIVRRSPTISRQLSVRRLPTRIMSSTRAISSRSTPRRIPLIRRVTPKRSAAA